MDVGGILKDITPTGFTTGLADATATTGYGYWTYGSLSYGTARPDIGAVPVTVTGGSTPLVAI
jgi:hypothetical protein